MRVKEVRHKTHSQFAVPEYLCALLISVFRVYKHWCWNSKRVKTTDVYWTVHHCDS